MYLINIKWSLISYYQRLLKKVDLRRDKKKQYHLAVSEVAEYLNLWIRDGNYHEADIIKSAEKALTYLKDLGRTHNSMYRSLLHLRKNVKAMKRPQAEDMLYRIAYVLDQSNKSIRQSSSGTAVLKSDKGRNVLLKVKAPLLL